MTRTPGEIANDIIAKLNVVDATFSLEIGTPERKIVDAVAESISESQIDNYLTSTQLNIDTKSGIELEEFVAIFGYGRLKGRAATGEVTFNLALPPIQDVQIPSGTAVFVPTLRTNSSINFIINQAGYIAAGTTSITLPAQCSIIGTIGNVQAGTITGFTNSLGFSSVTNLSPFTGGSDDESDSQLRDRFKKTFLRNIAGTEDFYLALVLQAIGVKKAKLLGPYNWFVEMLEMDGTNPVTSTNTNSKFTWPEGYAISLNKGEVDEHYYIPGTDYVANTSVLPTTVTPSHADLIASNVFAFFEHQYTSKFSRNDPTNGITNKVDVFMDGVQAVGVSETIVIPSTNLTYGSGSAPTDASRFVRADGIAMPSSGTFRLIRLGSTPLVTYPPSIVVGVTTYTLGTHYVGLKDATLMAGTERSYDAILFHTGTQPTPGGTATIDYSYNRLPEVLNSLAKSSKQITTDVLVHAARTRYLAINLLVVYDNNVSISAVAAQITTELSNFLNNLTFGSWVQFSDIAAVVHNIRGVDNCRVAKIADGVSHSIQSKIGTNVIANFDTDFKLDDNEVASLHSVNILRAASNTYSA